MKKVKIAIDVTGKGVLLEKIDKKYQDSLVLKLASLDLSTFKPELYNLYYYISQYEISINDIKPVKARTAYICSITFDHELGETPTEVYQSKKILKSNMGCADSGECSSVKLKIYKD